MIRNSVEIKKFSFVEIKMFNFIHLYILWNSGRKWNYKFDWKKKRELIMHIVIKLMSTLFIRINAFIMTFNITIWTFK